MSRWLNRKTGMDWRPRTWGLIATGFAFLFVISISFATTTTWDFGTPGDYTCKKVDGSSGTCVGTATTNDEIIVTSGVARLAKSFTVTHDTQTLFNTGTYSNTESVTGPDGVQFTQVVIDAATAVAPATGTYTSVILDGGVATTTWKKVAHTRTLQQAAPPAAFDARVVGTELPGSNDTRIRKIALADLNRDGIPDTAVTLVQNSSDSSFFYYQNANPPLNPLTRRWLMDDVAPIGSPCTAANQGADGVDGARTDSSTSFWPPPPLVGDLDNDLSLDLMEARQRLGSNIGLFLYQNPYSAGGGVLLDPPECFTMLPQSGAGRRLLEDIRLANINKDTYVSTNAYRNTKDILDVVGVERTLGTGSTSSPTGGVFWFRNDGTTTPDAPVFGLRSIDVCKSVLDTNADGKPNALAAGPMTGVAGDLDKDGDIDVVAAWVSDIPNDGLAPTDENMCEAPDGTITRKETFTSEIRGYISGGGDPPVWSPAASTGVPPGWQIYNLPDDAGTAVTSYMGNMQIADMDADGYLDIVYAHVGAIATTNDSQIYWLENPCTATPCVNGTGAGELRAAWTKHDVETTGTSAVSTTSTDSWVGIYVEPADLDLDGDMDLLANDSTQTGIVGVTYYENTGGGLTWTKRNGGNLATANGAGAAIVGNMTAPTGDRAPDIIATMTSGSGGAGQGGTIDWFKNTTAHSNIYFQVRSCDDAACSGEIFVGPDGTANTYYARNKYTGTVSEDIKVPDNRYFQYKVFFYSNKGDATPEMNPKLTSVVVDYDRTYFTDNPYVYPTTAISYSRITDFTDTLGAGHQSGATVTYQICRVADACYYWNATTWAVAASPANSNDGTTVKLNIGTFEDVVGHGAGQSSTFYVKTFLNSDGAKQAEIDTIVAKEDLISLGNLTSPVANSSYNVDDFVNITWSSYSCAGTPCGTLRFEYSVDSTNGSDGAWALITELANISAGGTHSWSIPGAATSGVACIPPGTLTDCTSVRVKDKDTPVIRSWSGRFKVVAPTGGTLTVTSPTGSSIFIVGNSLPINWDYSGPVTSPLRIDYTLNDGVDGYANVIESYTPGVSKGTGGSGSYSWAAIPNSAVSAQVKVRVRDSSGVPVDGFSAGLFKIKGITELKTPSPGMGPGEIYTVGNSTKIEWKTTGSIPNVKLQYSRLGDFTDATNIIASVANGLNGCTLTNGDSTGCYNWTLPDNTATTMKIRVVDARAGLENYSGLEKSTNTFTNRGAVYLNQTGDSPIASTVWQVGTNVMFNWHSTGAGAIPNVKLEYSKSGGQLADWEVVAASAINGQNGTCTPPANVGALIGGCYEWALTATPDRIAIGPKVRISHSTDTNVTVTSAPFNVKGYLNITEPGNTIQLVTADVDSPTVTWTSIGNVVSVHLFYSTDGAAWTTITTGGAITNDGQEAWAVPAGAVDTSTFIKVADADTTNHPVTEATSAAFGVKGKLTFASTPSGTIVVGDTPNLTWTKSSTLTNLNLYYSTDGAAWTTSATGLSGTSTTWTVPAQAIGTSVTLKIKDMDTAHPASENISAAFAVKGVLTFTTSPSGTITVNDQVPVAFSKTSTISNVGLYYVISGAETLITTTSATALTWTVPSAAVNSTVNLRIKDADAGHPVTETTSSAFGVKGTLAFTSTPSGTLTVGAEPTISWSKVGNIPTVNLYYDIGAGDVLIAGGLTGTSIAWTVPAAAVDTSVTLKVKDADVTHPLTEVVSAAFAVKGTISVNAPAALLTVGTVETLAWTKTSTITTMDLFYSTDGSTWTTIIAGATGTSYNWNPPAGAVGTSVTVKVKDADANHPLTEGISAATQVQGVFAYTTSPSGTLTVGNQTPIVFTKTSTITSAALYYAIGAGETLITTTSATSLTWTVPADAVAGTVTLKLKDATAGHPLATTTSSSFAVKGTVTFSSTPSGTITVGDQPTISWTKSGNIPTVNLSYDIGAGDVVIASGLTGTSTVWTVPAEAVDASITLKVKDADATHPLTEVVSAAFAVQGTLAMTEPAALLTVGGSETLAWTKTSTITSLDLFYSTDGSTWTTITTGAAGTSYNWTPIPAQAIGSSVLVKAKDSTAGHLATEDNTNAVQVQGVFAFTTSPSGTITVNNQVPVVFTKTSTITSAALYYAIGAGETLITTTSATSLTWTVPAEAVAGTVTLKLKDATAGHPLATTTSSSFGVKGSLAFTSTPSGTITAGDEPTITWSKTGNIATVNLYYDIGAGDVVIASGLTGTSTTWPVPAAAVDASVTLKVKDADATHPLTEVVSAAFGVQGSLAMVEPAALLTVGNAELLTWTKTSTITSLDLFYSTDGSTWTTITTGATGTSYNWTPIPAQAIGTAVLVRVKDVTAGHLATVDNTNAFQVQGVFTFTTSPSGTLTVGDATPVVFTKTSTITDSALYYAVSGTETLITTTSATSLTWTVPSGAVGGTVALRLKDATAGHPLATTSSSNFAVKGSLAFTSTPSGTITAGDEPTITWTKAGNIATVNLYYDIGAGDVVIASGLTGTSTVWTVPAAAVDASVTLKVKDADATHPLTEVVSAAFAVQGTLAMVEPAALLTVGNAELLTWTKTSTITSLDLFYSTDGAAWTTITTGATGTSYNWTPIPAQAIGSAVLVRVKDVTAGHLATVDNTNAVQVQGVFTFTTSPSGTLTVGNQTPVAFTKTSTITNVGLYYAVGGSDTLITTTSATALTWTVPDGAVGGSVTLKLKDADTGHPLAATASSAFGVKGTVTFTSTPSGTITAGDQPNIVWTKTGNIPQVDLYYKVGSGSEVAIATNFTGTNLTWTVPAEAVGSSVTLKVKDSDATHPLTELVSAAFAVQGSLAMTEPAALLTVGTAELLAWTKTSTITALDLFYSTDGAAWTTITTGATGTSYNWTPPAAAIGTAVQVKVKDVTAGHLATEDNTNAVQVQGVFAFTTSPSGTLTVGGATPVVFTKTSTITSAGLYYAVGGTETLITTTSATSLTWTVPDGAVGGTVTLKLKDATAGHPLATTASSAFGVKGILAFTSTPTGTIAVGAEPTITWSKTGNIPSVNLYYNIGAGDVLITGGLTGTSTVWTVPAEAIDTSVTLKVKDADVTHPLTEVVSGSFVVQGSLNFSSTPSGTITVGDIPTLVWAKTSTLTNLNLYYSTDGSTWTTIITGISGTSYNWTVPAAAVDTSVTLKIADADPQHPTTESISPAFTVQGVFAFTTSPSGTITVGDQKPVVFTKTSTIASAGLYYDVAGTETLITTTSATALTWTVPADAVGGTVTLKLRDATTDHPPALKTSAAFGVKGTLAFTSTPTGIITVADTPTVTWSKAGNIATVNLYYNTGSGDTLITSGLTGTSLIWTVPDGALGANVTLKVKDGDASHPLTEVVSGSFTVKGSLNFASTPSGTITVGDIPTLTWTKTSTLTNLNLFYSTDGSTWTTITTGQSGTSYAWTAPAGAVGSSVTLKILDADPAHPAAQSISAPFTVQGVFSFTTVPSGILTVGDATPVAFTKTASITNVGLYYDVSGTETLITTTSATSLTWTVPSGAVGGAVSLKLRDADAGHPPALKTSSSFGVKGSLAFTTTPTGVVTVADGASLVWTKSGNIPQVNLYYKVGAGSDVAIATNYTGTSLTWTVPAEAVGSSVTLKVKDADSTHPLTETISAAFGVKGDLQITDPAALLTVGTNENLTWTKTATITTLNLFYSTNGSTWTTITTGATGTAFNWNVPAQAVGTSVTVKVKDADTGHPSTEDISNPVQVQGVFAFTTSPSGTLVVGNQTPVAWTKTSTITNVGLYYVVDGTEALITTTSATSLTWTVDNGAVDGTVNLRLRDADAGHVAVTQTSSAFSVKGILAFTDTPSGTKAVGNQVPITWTKTGNMPTVNVYYKVGAGSDTAITANFAASTLTWTIPPEAVGTSVVVKVVDADATHVLTDVTSSAFAVTGVLSFTGVPTGTIAVGDAPNIVWTKSSSIASVSLHYSTNGSTWTTIASPITATNYTWSTVPAAAIGTSVTLKIVDLDASHPATETTSAPFAVKGVFSFTTSPSGTKTVGDQEPVAWTKTSTITNTGLYYSIAGTDTLITTTSTTSLTWTVPAAAVAGTVTLKVKDADAGHPPSELSSTSFGVKGILAFTANPTGVITVGDTPTVTWSKNGNMPTVNLYYKVGTAADQLIASDLTVTSVTWTVPVGATGASVTLKVKDADISHASTETVSGTFGVKGQLSVTQPDGVSPFQVGDITTIAWTKSSSISLVDLFYSTDGSTWTTITNTGPVGGTTFSWTIPPGALGTATKVKAKDADTTNHALTEAQSASFPVRGKLTITNPGGNPNTFVEIAQPTTITWTRDGTTGPMAGGVTLWYTINNGTDGYPNQITCTEGARLAGDLSCTWTVPDNATTAAKVKIILTNDTAVTGTSPNVFAIRGKLTMVAPDGDPDGAGPGLAEDWEVESVKTVKWTKFGTTGAMTGNVQLKYSVNNGADSYPYQIATDLVNGVNGNCTPPSGGGCYDWVVSDAVSNNVKVKIILLPDPGVTDTSNNPFTVRAGFTVTAPAVNEIWKASLLKTITWNKRGSVPNVKIQYSKLGNFSDAVTIHLSANNGSNTAAGNGADGDCTATAGTGCYVWKVTEAGISETAKIRVSDSNDSVSYDDSAQFMIRSIMDVVAPSAGTEIWPVGSQQTVSWTAVGTIPNVRLEYSTNGFSDEMQTSEIIAATPTYQATGSCTPPPAGGCYVWTIPDSISAPGSTNVKVRVSDPNVAATKDISNLPFRIVGGFTMTAPNGAESWPVGSTQTITWNKWGSVNNANLFYTTNGTSWTTIKAFAVNGSNTDNGGCTAPAGTGCFKWVIPDAISAASQVRVADYNDPDGKDASNANFDIRADLTLSGPNGAEIYAVGSQQSISWKTVGTVANVKLEYSKLGNFSDTVTIATPVNVGATGACTIPAGDTGCYLWTVPNAIANNTVKVRVTDNDAGHPAYSDASNATFTIKAYVEVKVPNGSEIWGVLTPQTISWTTTNPATATVSTVANVDVFYTTNGTTWTTLLTNGVNGVNSGCTIPAGATGCLNWTVLDTPTATAKVRVRDKDSGHPSSEDDSNTDFEIRGTVTITSPTSGETWTAGDAKTIAFDTTGQITTVKVEYSKLGNFTDAVTINATATNNPNRDAPSDGGGSQAWNVADAIGTTAKIRVSDTGNPNVKSEMPLNIKAYLEMKTPNGAERWITNQIKDITWTTINPASGIRSTVGAIKLEYTGAATGTISTTVVDGANGATSTYLNALTCTVPAGATGCYPWEVADLPTVNATITQQQFLRDPAAEKIKISDNVAGHPVATDDSNATFNVDYWQVVWSVRDSKLGNQLSNLEGTFNYTKPDGSKFGVYSEVGLQSPFTIDVPASPINQFGSLIQLRAQWDRPGYFVLLQSWASNGDLSFTLDMDSTLIHEDKAISEFSYDAAANTFTVDSWLDHDGAAWPQVQQVIVTLYDFNSATATDTAVATLTVTCTTDHSAHPHSAAVKSACPKGPDERGVFRQSWKFESAPGVPLAAKTYKVVTSIWMVSMSLADPPITSPGQLDANKFVSGSGGGGGAGPATGTGLARSVLVYDPVAKNFKIDSWLTLDGKVSTTVSQAAVTITDSDTGATVFGMPLTSATNVAGIFRQTWLFKDSGGVTLPAKTYKVKSVVTTTGGVTFEGMDMIDARTAVAVGNNLGVVTLPGGATDLGDLIDDAKNELKTDIAGVKSVADSIKVDTGTTIQNKLNTLQTDVTAIHADTLSIPGQLTDIQARLTSEYRARILPRDPITLVNTPTTIRYRTTTGLAPKLDVYQGAVPFLLNAPMTEAGTTGIYSAAFTPTAIGEYVIICTEPTKASTDTTTITARLENETTIMATLNSLNNHVTTTLTNNVDTILSRWGTQNANSMKTDLNNLIANLGASTDTSAANTLFGKAKLIQEKWGSQSAQALYDQVVLAYNKAQEVKTDLSTAKSDLTLHVTTTVNTAKTEILGSMTNLQNTVQASVGAIDAAVLELSGISSQMAPSVTSLTNAASSIQTQVSALNAATSEVTSSITALQTSANEVKVAAAGIGTKVEQSEGRVKSHAETQRVQLQSDLVARGKEIQQTVGAESQTLQGALKSTQTSVLGAVTGGTETLKGATTEILTKIGRPEPHTSVYADLLALRTIMADVQTKIDAMKPGGSGAGGGGTGGSGAGGGGAGEAGGAGGSGTADATQLEAIAADLDAVKTVVDAMQIDIDTVASDASKASTFAMSASSNASSAQAAAAELKALLGSSGGKIADQLVGALLAKLNEIQSDVSIIRADTNDNGLSPEVQAALAQLVGLKTNEAGEMIPADLAQSKEVQVLQGKMDEVKALIEVINVLVRQQSTRPVIKTWFEAGE